MMKKIILIILVSYSFLTCSKPGDCVESTGKLVSKTVAVAPFTKIYVKQGIELIVKQGLDFEVVIKTGENLVNDISVSQDGNTITLKDNTTCNWVREYGQTKVYVTAPNIEEIYSKSERNISSDGVLTYPNLRLLSIDKDGDKEKGAGTGDFYFNVNNNTLYIESNNVSRFYISGQTNTASFNFFTGDGRIESQNLTVQNLYVYHRGTNDMIVKPIQKIEGILNSTGDVILKNNPPIVSVQQLYQGHVIYN